MIDLVKLQQHKRDLTQQADVLKHQLAMVEGAIQYNDQLIEQIEKEEADKQPASSESAKDEGIQEVR